MGLEYGSLMEVPTVPLLDSGSWNGDTEKVFYKLHIEYEYWFLFLIVRTGLAEVILSSGTHGSK